MRLVNGYEVYLHPFYANTHSFGSKPFGREVQEFGVAMHTVVEGKVYLAVVHARIDGYGFDAPAFEILHLVFHEGDEGRNDKAQTFVGKGGHLEANGFAAAGGQQCKGVVALHNGGDDLLLQWAESAMPPILQ